MCLPSELNLSNTSRPRQTSKKNLSMAGNVYSDWPPTGLETLSTRDDAEMMQAVASESNALLTTPASGNFGVWTAYSLPTD